jgi:hypothetical protein
MVATRPDLRVGDAERDTTATLLREHYAQGRLSTDELNERLDATFSATIQGQLAEITHDLPLLMTAAPPRRPPAPVPHHHHGQVLAKVVTLLVVAAMVLGVAAIAHGAGSHVPRTIAELLVLLLVLRAVAGRHAGRRHWEHHAARYGSDGYGSDGYGEDGTGSDGFSAHRPHPGHPGGHFHEHRHEHHRGWNGHSYRYSYDYERSDGFDRRDTSGQSGRVQ